MTDWEVIRQQDCDATAMVSMDTPIIRAALANDVRRLGEDMTSGFTREHLASLYELWHTLVLLYGVPHSAIVALAHNRADALGPLVHAVIDGRPRAYLRKLSE